jgi:hypothetical protein
MAVVDLLPLMASQERTLAQKDLCLHVGGNGHIVERLSSGKGSV